MGYDSLEFGVTKSRVIENYGQPDKTYELDSGDICFEYHDRQVALNFDPELADALVWIMVKDNNATIEGQFLWSKSTKQIIEVLENQLKQQSVFDDYDSLESYGFEEVGLELQFELGKLCAINIGVFYDESGEPKWPNS